MIVVAEDGDRAGWVRNAQAQEGRLRVHIAGRWTAATLQVLDDEPEPYLQRMNKVHAALVRAHSTEMKVVELTIGDGGTLMDRTPASPEDE